MIDRKNELPWCANASCWIWCARRRIPAAAGVGADLVLMRRIDELHLKWPFLVLASFATCCKRRL